MTKTKPTPQQIAKLPFWAQDHIAALTRERDEATQSEKELLDQQTRSKVCVDYYAFSGSKPKWIQSDEVTFVLAEHEVINIRAKVLPSRKPFLDIRAIGTMSRIVVLPHANNAIELRTIL